GGQADHPPRRAPPGARRAQRARAAHLRGAPPRRRSDHARGAGRGVRSLARAGAADRGARLREGAARGEEPHRRHGSAPGRAGADRALTAQLLTKRAAIHSCRPGQASAASASRDPVITARAVPRLREGMDYWVPAFAGTTIVETATASTP